MDWYDHAEIYDLAFSWDPAAERAFVLGASERWGIAAPRRILEPFCGPGRLLRHMPGRAVGFDKNPHMVRHAARDCTVFRADAARFAVAPRSFDLAYCLIDSFRHLPTERAARDHLGAVARALRPGAVYVLGFDVAADAPADVSAEEWTEARGDTTVACRVAGLGDADPDSRVETMHARFEVAHGDGRRQVVEGFSAVRTYTRREVEDLVDDEGSFEIAACFDRHYDLARPLELSETTGSVVLVLEVAR